jgi:hypothetical protein
LIPYRRQAADFIHAYRRDYIESYVEVLDFQGLLCFFRGDDYSSFLYFPGEVPVVFLNTLQKY